MDNLKERLLEATAIEIEENGLSFTMSDIANRLGISKKTLYECVSSKEEVINSLIDESRDSIKRRQLSILEKSSSNAVEKIKALLTVVPDFHLAFNYRRLLQLKRKYPGIYERVVTLFEDDWEPTFELMKKAMFDGEMKDVNLFLFREMYCSAVTSLYDERKLEKLDLTYKQSLEGIIEILLGGILKGQERL